MSERLTILARCDLGDELADVLASWRADGIDVRLVPERRDEAAFLAALPDADILLHVLNPVTAAAIAAAPRLKLIQKVGVGVNTIDLDAARAAGIAVCNMPGTNTGAVAELTIALMLAALRRVPAFVGEARRTAGWLQPPGREGSLGEIGGRVVGLIGAGAVASRVAAICAAMGAEVIYWSRSQRPDMPATLSRLRRSHGRSGHRVPARSPDGRDGKAAEPRRSGARQAGRHPRQYGARRACRRIRPCSTR